MPALLIAVCHLSAICRNPLEWAKAHIRWRLALCRGVLFMDKSWGSLYWAHGRQCAWYCLGELFADVSVVNRVAPGGGGVMVWAGVIVMDNKHRWNLLMIF